MTHQNATPTPTPSPTPGFQLLSTDFDGTVFAEFEMPPVQEALVDRIAELQGAGVQWAINTGRDMTSLLECLARARLPIQPDYLIVVEREIYRHNGSRYEPVQPWNNTCTEIHRTLFERVEKDMERLIAWIQAHSSATVYPDPYSPLCLIARSNPECDAVMEYLEAYARTVPNLAVVRNDVYARFSHTAYSKGSALAEVGRLLGIGPERIVAAGDHLNDLPMLLRSRAHHLISPANALPVVKAQVLAEGGFVSDKRCSDGVLDGINRLHATHTH